MASSIATTSTPVATKIQIWNVDIYCTKDSIRNNSYENPNILRYMKSIGLAIPQQVNDMLDNIMYSNLIAFSIATFNWKGRYKKAFQNGYKKVLLFPKEKNFSVPSCNYKDIILRDAYFRIVANVVQRVVAVNNT